MLQTSGSCISRLVDPSKTAPHGNISTSNQPTLRLYNFKTKKNNPLNIHCIFLALNDSHHCQILTFSSAKGTNAPSAPSAKRASNSSRGSEAKATQESPSSRENIKEAVEIQQKIPSEIPFQKNARNQLYILPQELHKIIKFMPFGKTFGCFSLLWIEFDRHSIFVSKFFSPAECAFVLWDLPILGIFKQVETKILSTHWEWFKVAASGDFYHIN